MKCGICGEEHKSINYLHLRRHNLDYATYVALYPNNAGHDKCGYEVKYFTDKEVYRHTDRVLAEVAIFEGVGVLC